MNSHKLLFCNRSSDLHRSAVVGIIFLSPLLGVTWIIGVFAIDSNSTVFLWIFTITNSLQVFIYKIIDGLLDRYTD